MAGTDPPETDEARGAPGSRSPSSASPSVGAADTLATIAGLAVATIDGCDLAGIVVLVDGALTSSFGTGALVAEVDALQGRAAEGPCIDAITGGRPCHVDDLGDDARWPRYGP